jgi:hypothetical protein
MAQDDDTVAVRLRRLEDLEAIRRLFQDYRRHLDRKDFRAYAELFAAEGEFVAGPDGSIRAKGPGAIFELVDGMRGSLLTDKGGDDVHVAVNEVILPPAGPVRGRPIPHLVEEPRPFRGRVVVVGAQRPGQAHGLSGANQRCGPRPRVEVDEVGRPAPVALAERACGGEFEYPLRRLCLTSIGYAHTVVLLRFPTVRIRETARSQGLFASAVAAIGLPAPRLIL